MDNIASNVIRWTVRFSSVILLVITFVLIFNFLNSSLTIVLNNTLFGELMAMVQMWTPFNFGQIFAWITTAAGLVTSYYIYAWCLKLINQMIG